MIFKYSNCYFNIIFQYAKKNKFYLNFFIFTIDFPFSQECEPHQNNCKQCHPVTNLCVVCDNNVYKPDENGGCEPIHKCSIGEKYCIECNDKNDLCLQCEVGFCADENGGCSICNNSAVSENGNCLRYRKFLFNSKWQF